MSASWDLNLSIDANGHDDTRVSIVRGVGSSPPHLKVRVGLVVVQCLDAASAMSAARAWAAAQLARTPWLATLPDARLRTAAEGRAGAGSAPGAAYPTGSILFEGRQPWHVEPGYSTMTVTVGPLQVRSHDAVALDTHIRAWTEAAAVATRVFPDKAVPFDRLVQQVRAASLRVYDLGLDPGHRAKKRRTIDPPKGPSSERTQRQRGPK